MIEKIDNDLKDTRKYKKILKAVIAFFVGTIIVFGIFLAVFSIKYNSVKDELEAKYISVIEQNNFEMNNGHYELLFSENIRYTAPNQKMPRWMDFKLHFYAKHLQAYIEQEDAVIEIVWNEYDSYTIYKRERDNYYKDLY